MCDTTSTSWHADLTPPEPVGIPESVPAPVPNVPQPDPPDSCDDSQECPVPTPTTPTPTPTPTTLPQSICLESKFLKVIRGPWRFHATSKCRIPKGTVITRNWALAHQSVHAHVPDAEDDAHAEAGPSGGGGSYCCSHCLATPRNLFRCSSCQSARYCGRDCQRKDFHQHKYECRYLTQMLQQRQHNLPAAHSAPVMVRHSHDSTVTTICFVLRTYGAIHRLHTTKHLQCSSTCPPRARTDNTTVTCGIHHWNFMAVPPPEISHPAHEDTAEYRHILQTVANYCTWNTTQVAWTLQVFQVNNFGILNSLHETIAQGVYPHAALLNHSCDPNCILRFGHGDTNNQNSDNSKYSTRMEIVALRDIDQGDELTHAYVDLVQDRTTRQTHLQQLHAFLCTCRRCQGHVTVHLPTVPPDNLYEWIVQQRNPCLGTKDSIDLQQQQQHNLVPWSVDEALCNYGACAGDPATAMTQARLCLQESQQHMASNNIDKEIATLRHALTLLDTTAPPLSKDLYQVRGALLSALLVLAARELDSDQRERILQEARDTCLAMVAFLTVALPENHPLLGLQLFTLGDLTEDKTVHAWARHVLRTSHGTHHDLVRRLDDILES